MKEFTILFIDSSTRQKTNDSDDDDKLNTREENLDNDRQTWISV